MFFLFLPLAATLPARPTVLSTPLLSSVALSSVPQVEASRVGLLFPTT